MLPRWFRSYAEEGAWEGVKERVEEGVEEGEGVWECAGRAAR